MEYALYIVAVITLLIGFFLHRRRKRKQFTRALDNHHTTRTFEPGSDPIEDRIEFHFINRRRD